MGRFSTPTWGAECRLSLGLFLSLASGLSGASAPAEGLLEPHFLWRYCDAESQCEICAYVPESQGILITVASGVRMLGALSGDHRADLLPPDGFHATSVAVSGAQVAVAWAATDHRRAGLIGFYEAQTLRELALIQAGFHPDMVTFSPDGNYLLAANEGEPTEDYRFDPKGSITLVDLRAGLPHAVVRELDFHPFDRQRSALRQRGVRLVGPSRVHPDGQATVSEDLEPEYIVVEPNSQRAWVTLQENNAVAGIDLREGRITGVHPLGLKNFQQANSLVDHCETTGLDASDTDGGSHVRVWPVQGLFQPDGIAWLEHAGVGYLVTANEGDPRHYADYHEGCAVAKLGAQQIGLDAHLAAPTFLAAHQLGRLEVSSVSGDTDSDGDLDELHCFGARSFSVWQFDATGALQLLFDSGNDFERITAQQAKSRFNADSLPDSPPDVRSAMRGPEPESVLVGEVDGHRLALISLERTGGVMLYDLSQPAHPQFLRYLPPYEADGILDCAPEGMALIPMETSPTGKPLLVVCHEGSGTTTTYELAWKP
jgi:hypothetical protein